MIRRLIPDDPSHCRLIAQHDHALAAAQIARQIAPPFLPRQMSDSAMLAIEQHDCGWPTHDDLPTLNKDGQPLDVFETSLPIALRAWKTSVELIEPRDPHAALLISLHVFALSLRLASTIASNGAQSVAPPGEKLTAARARFQLNQFQHREIERHESLRKAIGLPGNQPLQHGLATESKDPREIAIVEQFHLLQAADRLSLEACCVPLPMPTIELAHTDRRRPVIVSVRRIDDVTLALDPWPFLRRQVSIDVPSRVVGSSFNDVEAFRAELSSQPVQKITQTFIRGH